MCKNEESKTTQIMMATVPHVTSGSGLRKFLADGFLLDWVYQRTGSRIHIDPNFIGQEPKKMDSWFLTMGPISCPDTMIGNYHDTQRKTQKSTGLIYFAAETWILNQSCYLSVKFFSYNWHKYSCQPAACMSVLIWSTTIWWISQKFSLSHFSRVKTLLPFHLFYKANGQMI